MVRRDRQDRAGRNEKAAVFVAGLPPQNLDVRFDDFLIEHEPGIPYGGVNPELSGAGARVYTSRTGNQVYRPRRAATEISEISEIATAAPTFGTWPRFIAVYRPALWENFAE